MIADRIIAECAAFARRHALVFTHEFYPGGITLRMRQTIDGVVYESSLRCAVRDSAEMLARGWLACMAPPAPEREAATP